MEVFWNKLHLEHPPNLTFRIRKNQIDTETLLTNIERANKDLESQDVLHTEAAILSRLIYRMKTKFRTDKGLKSMEKVNRALLNYLSLALDKEYNNFKSYIEEDEQFINLPSKQMLEYILVRTQGFAKLMVRVEEVSRCAAHLLRSRINLGHAWTVSIIAYSVVSRIWLLSRYLVKRSCTWYNNFYRYLLIFKPVGLPWLPKDQALPSNLATWLDVLWIHEKITNVPKNEDWQTTMFKLLKPSSEMEEELKCDVEQNLDESKPPTCSSDLINSTNFIDIGEHIDRSTFIETHSKSRKSHTPKIDNNSPGSVHRKGQLNTFNTPKTSKLNKSSIKILNSLLKKQHLSSNTNRIEGFDHIIEEFTTPKSDKNPVTDKRKGDGSIDSNKTEENNDCCILEQITECDKSTITDKSSTKQNGEPSCVDDSKKIVNSKKRKQKSDAQTARTDEKRKCSKKSLKLEDVKTKQDLMMLLNTDSYEGLDKLRWNIIKNKSRKLLNRIEKSSNSTEQSVLIKKTIKRLRAWID